MLLKMYKNLDVPNIQQSCKIWTKTDGYLAENSDCGKKMKLSKLSPVWQATFPDLQEECWSTVKKKEDPRCHMPVPGFGHPHIVMVDDYLYTLHLDLL